jgi:hypothetical protein
MGVLLTKNWQIPRRRFLKGLGTVLALPLLEAMAPSLALAAGKSPARKTPLRMAFLYVPNGADMANWKPKAVGSDFELPQILTPLQPVRDDILVLTGLAHDKARPNGDGAGDHARASATFLTGCQARKTHGADIRVGISADQVAALRAGKETRFPSLELGCDRGQLAGSCDSGYSCAYSYNISWRSESTPMPPEVDPRIVFERMFSNNIAGEVTENRERRKRYQQSILDFVLEDARQLKASLGTTDRRKVDEYLTAVRELELRIEQSEKFVATLPDYKAPKGIPADYAQHIRLMFDLLALAFQTDSTRIATFILAHDGSNRAYPFIGVSHGHHDLSHHQNDVAKKEMISKINRFHIEQFAYFLQKLKSTPEGEGTLLDNCMIAYGSGLSDGNRHNHDDLPVLYAGRGGGTIKTGRHIRYGSEIPMTNLYLSMLERFGTPTPRLGDSTGLLKDLS